MGQREMVLGIDGGGTKTLVFLADAEGTILIRKEGPATNPHVVGFETSTTTLRDLVVGICADGRVDPAEIRAAVAGLAGAGREADRKQIRDETNEKLRGHGVSSLPLSIETDVRIALEGAFGGAPGVVVISGTGSHVLGKSNRGEVFGVGGWGRVLGDEGSGYAIGRDAVIAVTLDYDKRGEAKVLRSLIASRFGWNSRDAIIAAIYKDGFNLAALAPIVMEAASDHDLVSQRILQRGATLLVEQIQSVVMRMGISRKVSLVMVGGLVEGETVYRNVLHMKLLKLLPQVDVRPSQHPPAHGAVLMALERLKKS